MYRFTEYCECGGQLTGSISDYQKWIAIKQVFWSTHFGAGHSPTNRQRCARARAKEELSSIYKAKDVDM